MGLIYTKKPVLPSHLLNRQIMCGQCNFLCCNSPTFHVEVSAEEQEIYYRKYGLNIVSYRFNQDGHCQFSSSTGCLLGEDRPLYCKIYPLVEQHSRLTPSFWSIMHCPVPESYECQYFHDVYYTKVRDRSNIRKIIVLDRPIEDFDPIYKVCEEAIRKIYGHDFYERLDRLFEKKC